MTSHRKRKQKARSMGLTEAELQLCELLGQVLELLRWNQVLGYSNQYLLHERLAVPPEERHRVMRAAAGAVEQDGRIQDWGRRLMEIQDALERIHARMQAGDASGAADDRSASGRSPGDPLPGERDDAAAEGSGGG